MLSEAPRAPAGLEAAGMVALFEPGEKLVILASGPGPVRGLHLVGRVRPTGHQEDGSRDVPSEPFRLIEQPPARSD